MIYDGIITKPPLDEDTLAHYGVKGMKWKVRKAKNKIRVSKATTSHLIDDYLDGRMNTMLPSDREDAEKNRIYFYKTNSSNDKSKKSNTDKILAPFTDKEWKNNLLPKAIEQDKKRKEASKKK